jgi:RHH-type proline utilization regulon transcriptional repressor/proline dehydrogenase/delta 1-pyrroline-5-carboxylate dehydrogenase
MRWRETGVPPAGAPIGDPLIAALLDALGERDDADAGELARLRAAVASYARLMDEEFGPRHDHFRLLGQDNLRLYQPAGHVRVRVDPRDGLFDVLARVCAARLAACHVTISAAAPHAHVELLQALTESWAGAIELVEESDDELAGAIRARQTDRVRYAGPDRATEAVRRAAAAAGLYLATAPVVAEGRIELLWYLREQSLSIDYHRYGNLGARAGEPRAEPA